MGYYYTVSGEIRFSNKRSYDIMELMYAEDMYPFDQNVGGFGFNDKYLTLSFDLKIKNVGSYIEGLLLFAFEIDKKVQGGVSLSGEEWDDHYDLEITKKGVKVIKAKIVWERLRGVYSDKIAKKNAKLTLKDPDLTKKLIAMELDSNKLEGGEK